LFVILPCLSSSLVCHPRRGSASAFALAVALAFLVVILEEDLRPPLHLPHRFVILEENVFPHSPLPPHVAK
jgi:hypothetical protein